MATTTTTTALSLLLLSGLFLIDLPSASALDCTPGYECNFAEMAVNAGLDLHLPNRKFLMSVSKAQQRPNYGDELRTVPGGPDPIHHQGSPQRRPRNSP